MCVLLNVPLLQVDRRTPGQLRLHSVPPWASAPEISTALQQAIEDENCDARLANVILPRANLPAPAGDALLNSFQAKLAEILRGSEINLDYTANVLTPASERSPSFVAFLKFRSSFMARSACDLLDHAYFNMAYMEAALVLKIEFFVPTAVEKFSGRLLQQKSACLRQESRGPVKIESKRWKGISH